MRRLLGIALTLVLFGVVLWAASWAVNATMPGALDRIWDGVGGGAAWAILVVVIILAGMFALLGNRKAGAKANGKDT